MTTRFDRDTHVEARGDGRCGRIDRGWYVVRGPNAATSRPSCCALGTRVGDPRALRARSRAYTAPPSDGPARIETRVERVGRSLTTLSARLLRTIACWRWLSRLLARASRPPPSGRLAARGAGRSSASRFEAHPDPRALRAALGDRRPPFSGGDMRWAAAGPHRRGCARRPRRSSRRPRRLAAGGVRAPHRFADGRGGADHRPDHPFRTPWPRPA